MKGTQNKPDDLELAELDPVLRRYCEKAYRARLVGDYDEGAVSKLLHEASEEAISKSRFLQRLRAQAESFEFPDTHLEIGKTGIFFMACRDCGEHGSGSMGMKLLSFEEDDDEAEDIEEGEEEDE